MPKQTKTIVDFGELNTWIVKLEKIMEGLNAIDKEMILSHSLSRVRARMQKAKAQDMVDNLNPFGLAKKVMQGLGKKEED